MEGKRGGKRLCRVRERGDTRDAVVHRYRPPSAESHRSGLRPILALIGSVTAVIRATTSTGKGSAAARMFSAIWLGSETPKSAPSTPGCASVHAIATCGINTPS